MSLVSSVRNADALVQRLAIANLAVQSGHQAAYFVGIIGTATYLLGSDAFGIAILLAVVNLSFVLGSAVSGVFIDRLGPRRVLVSFEVAYAAIAGATCLLPLGYRVLVVVSGAMTFLAGCIATTMTSFPPYLTRERESLKNANSLVDTAFSLAIVFGPAIGAMIAGVRSPQAVLAFSSACMLAAAAASLGLRERFDKGEAPGEKSVRGGALTEFAEGLRTTFASRDLRFLFLVGFFGFLAYGAFDALESLFYRDVLRVDVEWMGWLSTISGIGSVVGSAALLRIPACRVDFRMVAAALMLAGVGSMVYVGTDLLAVAAIGQALTGFGFGLLMPTQHMLTQECCDLGQLGRVNGVMRVGLNSSGILPLAISPFLANRFGVQAVLFSASALVAVMAALFMRGARTHDHPNDIS